MEAKARVCVKCGTEFSSRNCKVCAKARDAARYAKNRDQVKADAAAYRSAHPERVKASKARYYAKNVELVAAYNAKYHSKNGAEIKKKDAAYYATNKEWIKKDCAIYQQSHLVQRRTYNHKRRAILCDADGTHSASDIQGLLVLQKWMCPVCRASIKDRYHVDHVIPLSKGGGNGKGDIQLLCPTCNLSKSAKHPVDFMQSRGFLL